MSMLNVIIGSRRDTVQILPILKSSNPANPNSDLTIYFSKIILCRIVYFSKFADIIHNVLF